MLMEDDSDVIYVDFDELFHASGDLAVEDYHQRDQLYHESYHYRGNQMTHYEAVAALCNSKIAASNDEQLGGAKRPRGSRLGSKIMTKEQFYKIRPKIPRIYKDDPRKKYGTAFAEAYISCDFNTIWDFLHDHCTPDFLWVHQWVGDDHYINFPKRLEIRGVDRAAEYWFGRCLVAPDLALEMKDTKLFLRSDGVSQVACTFTIECTRIFDGPVSDSIIVQAAAAKAAAAAHSSQRRELQAADEDASPSTTASSSSSCCIMQQQPSQQLSQQPGQQQPVLPQDLSSDSSVDEICYRTMEKLDLILRNSKPIETLSMMHHHHSKRRRTNSATSNRNSEIEPTLSVAAGIVNLPASLAALVAVTSTVAGGEGNSNASSNDANSNGKLSTATLISIEEDGRKRLPPDTSITLLGTVTMYLTLTQKIHRLEMNLLRLQLILLFTVFVMLYFVCFVFAVCYCSLHINTYIYVLCSFIFFFYS